MLLESDFRSCPQHCLFKEKKNLEECAQTFSICIKHLSQARMNTDVTETLIPIMFASESKVAKELLSIFIDLIEEEEPNRSSLF